ncbi:hypothetical protein ACIPSX_08535 [Pectobacterium sp. CHL-2024]|uniref:hypothetical protein n=1 Tax=Pectobacterium sp. CHL-2024 TaxID=3377079 RepID=UPI00382E560E
MKRLPTCAEAKAHAKYLSRSLNISRSYAQDAVALRYNCHSWSELSTVFGQFSDKYMPFYGLASPEETSAFNKLLAPYTPELQSAVHPDRHVPESLIRKIAEGHIPRVSGEIMSSFIGACEESPPTSAEDIIVLLKFYDDSISRVLERHHKQSAINNPWLEPWVFGLRFYAYYHFKGKTVTILSREWDLDIHDAYPSHGRDRAFSRPWFQAYMVGYLTYLVKQFISLGYYGTVKICSVNNYSVLDYHRGKPESHGRVGIHRLYSALFDYGGEGKWSFSQSGHKHDFGIELPFDALISSKKGRR